MKIVLVTLATLLVSCQERSHSKPLTNHRLSGPHTMECEPVRNDFQATAYRCENSEAVCYMSSDGIACNFKGGRK